MTTTLLPPVRSSCAPARVAAPRLIQLDFLRGIAILLVIGRHYVVNANDAGFMLPIAGLWQRFGWSGVDLFFVLSGFLVGGLLCSEIRDRGSLDVKRFIIRRGLKIWPSYYVYIAFIAVAGAFFSYPRVPIIPAHDAAAPLWPTLLHFQNYYRVIDANGHNIPMMPRDHLWSLAVEEHFYLILPFVLLGLLLLHRNRQHRLGALPIVAVFTIVTCTLLRCFTQNLAPFPWGTHVYPTHMRVDGLFFGVLLAYLYHFKPWFKPWSIRYRTPLLLVGLALLAPVALVQMESNTWVPAIGFTMLYIGYGLILLAVLATPATWLHQPTRWQSPFAVLIRAVAWVGLFSYPIYLWHLDLGRFPVLYLHQYLAAHGIVATPAAAGLLSPAFVWIAETSLFVALAILTGAMMSRLIEIPVLVLRDRFFPRRAAALPAPLARPGSSPTLPDANVAAA